MIESLTMPKSFHKFGQPQITEILQFWHKLNKSIFYGTITSRKLTEQEIGSIFAFPNNREPISYDKD